jgi:hypothetical protein
MRNGIPEFRPRKALDRQLSSTTLNDIRRELESLRITRVVNGTFRKLPGGTEITVAPQRGGGGAPLDRHPFQIASRQNPDNANQYLVTVRPGTINQVLATNWTIQEAVAQGALKYVVLNAATANSAIISTELSLENAAPSQEQSPVKWGLPTQFSVLIGLVLGPQVWQVVFDNLSFAGVKRITTDRAAPEPGELPYDNYYAWQLQ